MLISCLGDIENVVKILINASTNNKKIPSNDTQLIQEGHLLVEHIFYESVEEAILGE